MPSAMSGENVKLICPLCYELWKMVLSVLFSYVRMYTLPYMEKNIKHHALNVAQLSKDRLHTITTCPK